MHTALSRSGGLALAGLLLSACTPPAMVRPLTPEQLGPFVTCPVPLSVAQGHLQTRGYEFSAEGDKEFTTAFKASERDTERFMLGSLAVQRERQYLVRAEGAGGIRFSVRYRETRFPHSEDRNGTVSTREYAPLATEDFVPTLKDMRSEVCDSPQGKPGSDPAGDRRLWDFVMKLCRAGNEEACEALRPR